MIFSSCVESMSLAEAASGQTPSDWWLPLTQRTPAMPSTEAPKASLSRAMRLRSLVTMVSSASRPSPVSTAAQASAEPWMASGLSATTMASSAAGRTAASFAIASLSPLWGGAHSAVRIGRPDANAWEKLVIVVFIAGIHLLVGVMGGFGDRDIERSGSQGVEHP